MAKVNQSRTYHEYEKTYELLNKMELPPDLIQGHMILTAVGKTKLRIENYLGILTCDCDKIVVQTRDCKLVICGKRLCIKYYTSEEMLITGKIVTISFEV